MDLQPILKGELVIIKPMQRTDFEALFDAAKDPMIWEQHPCKRHLKPEFEKFFEESMASKGALTIFGVSDGAIIGTSRFSKIDGVENGIEIGWTFLKRKYWGGMYNGQVKRLMIDHAFKFVDNVVFYVDKNNIRSQKAVLKIGGEKIALSESKAYASSNPNNETFVINRGNFFS